MASPASRAPVARASASAREHVPEVAVERSEAPRRGHPQRVVSSRVGRGAKGLAAIDRAPPASERREEGHVRLEPRAVREEELERDATARGRSELGQELPERRPEVDPGARDGDGRHRLRQAREVEERRRRAAALGRATPVASRAPRRSERRDPPQDDGLRHPLGIERLNLHRDPPRRGRPASAYV